MSLIISFSNHIGSKIVSAGGAIIKHFLHYITLDGKHYKTSDGYYYKVKE